MNFRINALPATLIAVVVLVPLAAGCVVDDVSDAEAAEIAVLSEADAPRRRVWNSAGDYASVDPAGRLATFVDWGTGDVAVHDLETGEDRRVTDTGGWVDNGSWAEYPIFSPNGREIAFSYGNVLAGNGKAFRYELRVIGVDGSGERVIFGFDDELAEDRGFVKPVAWSSTHGLLYDHMTPDAYTLRLVDPESGEVREVADMTDRQVSEWGAVGPDGRSVALVVDGELAVLDLESSALAASGIGASAVFGWRDGNVVFRGLDAAAADVLSVGFGDAGFSSRPPTRLMPGMQFADGRGQAGDRLFYHIPAAGRQLYVATMDASGETVLSPPAAITPIQTSQIMTSEWSPDGERVAYGAIDPAGIGRVFVRSADGTEVVELIAIERTQGLHNLEWTADGGGIIVNRLTAGSGLGTELLRIDAVSGQVDVLYELPDGRGSFAVTPDGRYAVGLESSEGPQQYRLVRIDLTTGEKVRLRDIPNGWEAVEMSPEGDRVALVTTLPGEAPDAPTALWTQPVMGGDYSVIVRSEDGGYHVERARGAIDWVGDEIFVAVGVWDEADAAGESHWLDAYPADGGDPRRLALSLMLGEAGTWTDGGAAWPAFGPEGRRVSLISGEARGELWMMTF